MAIVLALLAAASIGAPALAQPAPSQPVRMTILTVGLLYADNPSLHKELHLSDEQAKKLKDHREKWFHDYFGLPFADRVSKMSELCKANLDALTNILKPDQLNCFRELTLQAVQKEYGGRALRYPEIAERLKLTAEQLQALRTAKPAKVLTAEQMEEWKQMCGTPFAGTLAPSLTGFPRRPAGPSLARFLEFRAVQDELKLSDDQLANLKELRKKWNKAVQDFPHLTFEQAQGAEKTAREIDAAVLAMLKPEQGRRLKQIAVQQQMQPLPRVAILSLPLVAAELKLTPEQQKKIGELRRARRHELAAIYLSEEASVDIAEKVPKFRQDTYDQLLAMLDDGQRHQLNELIGPPLGKQLQSAGPAFGLAGSNQSVPLAIVGLAFAREKPLIEELKLSEAQAKKLVDIAHRYGEEARRLTTVVNDEAAAKQQDLAEHSLHFLQQALTPEQLQRLTQITLQQLTTPRRSGAVSIGGQAGEVALRFKELSDGLKLSDKQKEDLLDGEDLRAVLTKEQWDKWTEMLGPTFRKTLTPRGLGNERVARPGFLAYLSGEALQRELKLTDEQRTKLRDIDDHWADATANLADLRPDQRPARVEDARKAAAKDVGSLLDGDQKKRYRQIVFQLLAKQGLAQIVLQPEVRDILALTPEQLDEQKLIAQETARIRALVSTDRALRSQAEAGDGEVNAVLAKLTSKMDEKTRLLLNPDQRARLKRLLGEPFEAELHGDRDPAFALTGRFGLFSPP